MAVLYGIIFLKVGFLFLYQSQIRFFKFIFGPRSCIRFQEGGKWARKDDLLLSSDMLNDSFK